jgi:hypothetical protein
MLAPPDGADGMGMDYKRKEAISIGIKGGHSEEKHGPNKYQDFLYIKRRGVKGCS